MEAVILYVVTMYVNLTTLINVVNLKYYID